MNRSSNGSLHRTCEPFLRLRGFSFRLLALSALVGALVLGGHAPVQAQQAAAGDLTSMIEKARGEVAQQPASIARRFELANLYKEQGILNGLDLEYEVALNSFVDGLAVLEQSPLQVPRAHPTVLELNYGAAYSLAKLMRYEEAVRWLEPMVLANPELFAPRYLLGVTLVRQGTIASIDRGFLVLLRLAEESEGEAYATASQARVRLGYNVANIAANYGGADIGLELLDDLQATHGADPAANEAENQLLQYARGVYTWHSQGAADAIPVLESLGQANIDLHPNGIVSLKDVLASLYYESGVEWLSQNTEEANAQALALFEKAKELQPQDVHIRHGQLIALARLGRSDAMQEELRQLEGIDAEFAESILLLP